MNRMNKPGVLLPLLLLSVFAIVSFLVYQQIYSGYSSDTVGHLAYLYMYFYGDDFYIPHPLWHYGVWYTAQLFHISVENAAIVFSASLVTFWALLVYQVVCKTLKGFSYPSRILITVSVLVVGPLCIPSYKANIMLGQGSPNLWHNVTLWIVKPLALMAMIFVIAALKKHKASLYVLAFFVTIVSIFAKPSFVVVFLPSLFVFAWLKNIHDRGFKIFLALVSFASASILLYQKYHLGEFQDSQVVFDFLGVWSLYSNNIAISLLLALAFPLILVAAVPKVLEDDYILLSWLQVFFGIVLYACFAQTGHYYSHGNFGWSYMIALSFLYLFSIVQFFNRFSELPKYRSYPLLVLFLLQTAIGIYYLEKILEGQNPLFVSIYV